MKYFAFAVVMALMGVVQSMDCEDQKAADRVYCDAVRAKEWPDYKGTAKDCPTPRQTPVTS